MTSRLPPDVTADRIVATTAMRNVVRALCGGNGKSTDVDDTHQTASLTSSYSTGDDDDGVSVRLSNDVSRIKNFVASAKSAMEVVVDDASFVTKNSSVDDIMERS